MIELLKTKIDTLKGRPESLLSELKDIRESIKAGIQNFLDDLASVGEAGFDLEDEKPDTTINKFSIN